MKTRLRSLVHAWLILALLSSPGLVRARIEVAAPAPPGLILVENAGQFPAGARFLVWGAGATLWLADDAIWLTLFEQAGADPAAAGRGLPPAATPPSPGQGVNVKLSFPGANPHPRLEPLNRLETHVSFFTGGHPGSWRADVPAWGGMRYVDLYPGIDLELGGSAGRLLPRLAVRPGARLDAVRLRVEGVDAAAVDGDLLRLTTATGEVEWPLLRLEGVVDRAAVQRRGPGAFEVMSPFAPEAGEPAGIPSSNQAPSGLLYATYFGGGSGDWGEAVAVDEEGTVYVAGATQSADLPATPGAFDTSFNGSHDVHVLKVRPGDAAPVYVTFLGGTDGDSAHAIAVDGSGAAYITGHTDCYGFPSTGEAYDTTCNSPVWGGDAFVVKLDAAGTGLEYATFLGGSVQEGGFGIAVDRSGAAYVMGVTGSSDFSTTLGAFDTTYNGGTDAFVAKLNPAGSGLEYATVLGGAADEWSAGIAVDESGAAYLTGETASAGFPATPGAYDTSFNGGVDVGDAFVARLNPAGSDLEYATFLGGSSDDSGAGIDVGEGGAAYVTGYTYSSDLPTTAGALDVTYGGSQFYGDAFVARLNAAGSALDYATFLGGSLGEEATGIALDGSGAAYITGWTGSDDFATTCGAFEVGHNTGGSGQDAFLVKLNAAGSALGYSTFLGGSSAEEGSDIVLGVDGLAYVAGTTSSPDFPTTPGALDTSYNGDAGDAFVVEIAPTLCAYYLPLVFRSP